jgi:hypothetical protein
MINSVVSLRKILISILFFVVTYHLPLTTYHLFAQEITILYTGQTHAMLYPCGCPIEDDGGVARRASLVKALKKKNPNTILLDSGNFFAGGLLDQYTQNTQLDMQRTSVNLKAMEAMKYDAVAIGDDELNFGREFFQQALKKSNLTFLSANLGCEKILPYITKDIRGVKIGIIGLTSPTATQKAAGLAFKNPKDALREVIVELKKDKANIIIVLSNLAETENLNLAQEVKDIDILIAGYNTKNEPSLKIGSTLLVNPSWQGRKLGVLALSLKNNTIKNYKLDLIRLSEEIKDDKEAKAILPRCFSDENCKDNNLGGACLNPGSINASCKFEEHNKIKLTIIIPKKCIACDTEVVIRYLKKFFPGLTPVYLDYPGVKANKLIDDLKITGLPAYLLGEEAKSEKGFAIVMQQVEVKGKFFLLKPEIGGLAYLFKREKKEGAIDLFISLYDKNAAMILEETKDFNPEVHFLAVELKDNKFDAMKGNLEVEDYLRCVCVKKYYPGKFWDYISCRAKDINSSWWDNCLGDFSPDKIKTCATGREGEALLKENILLNKELRVIFGPAYLLNNQEIFTTNGAPGKESFKKIFKTK